jgi:hypothetical protein
MLCWCVCFVIVCTSQEVLELLSKSDHDQLLPPLQVLSILAENPNVPLWVAQSYVKKHLQRTATELERHQAGTRQ